MKPLTYAPNEWEKILEKIKKDQPPSVWLIRSNMRKKMGFTVREHQEWLGYYDDATPEQRRAKLHGYRTMIHLDFYDERYRSLFLLRYGSDDALSERSAF